MSPFLERGDDQMAFAVERDGLTHPPAAFSRCVGRNDPFGFIELGAVELVVPSEFPGLASGGGWQLIGQACLLSTNQLAANGNRNYYDKKCCAAHDVISSL
jgi:hypothetical protein